MDYLADKVFFGILAESWTSLAARTIRIANTHEDKRLQDSTRVKILSVYETRDWLTLEKDEKILRNERRTLSHSNMFGESHVRWKKVFLVEAEDISVRIDLTITRSRIWQVERSNSIMDMGRDARPRSSTLGLGREHASGPL